VKFCSDCGQVTRLETPDGDNRPRFVCAQCGKIHYENPRIVAGCVPVHGGRILLCKRAIEPRYGYWTVPAGFMELHESLPEAAIRETLEEARATVELGSLFAIVDVIQARQVHIFFEAIMAEPAFGAGDETLETRLFEPEEIPWPEIAFESVRIALKAHLSNRTADNPDVSLFVASRTSVTRDHAGR
jgi:ADP-ribose pyrophosphatase YjhB (NUDIX family)